MSTSVKYLAGVNRVRIEVDAEILDAVMSVLGLASDQTEAMLLNEFYDSVEAGSGLSGRGYITRMDENPNYEADDPDTWEEQPIVLPMVYDA